MRIIYTSVKGLRIKDVDVRGIDGMALSVIVRERRRILLQNATVPESVSAILMRGFDEKPIRQAYFRIRKRSYFLDFFFPSMMLAIEIDGSSHLSRKEHDRLRDADFRSIGIRTIRIKNADVMNGKLEEKIFKRLHKKA